MAEFRTPVKTKAIDIGEKITIPPSPFLTRLGYGTGISVMQLTRSPKAGQFRSPWALKMINKRVVPNKIYTERLYAEAELLKRMSHPNIVGFRAFSRGKILYLGMEACDLSLGDMIEKRQEEDCVPFEPKKLLIVGVDIGKALHYLHTKMNILHGDIKSYNILVNGDFKICKLCDFGVTMPLDANGVVVKNSTYYGTEAWSAPEVLSGASVTSKADVWALGLTLWEMLALTPPHAPHADSTLDMSLDSLDSHRSDLGDSFTDTYGTQPDIPANIPADEYAGPLAVYYMCTVEDARGRLAAEDVARLAAHHLADL